MYVCTFSNSYHVTWPQVGGGGMDKIRGGVHMEVGVGELPALLRYVKTTTTPTPTSTPTTTPIPEEQMDVEEHEQKPMNEKPIHVTEGGRHCITGVGTATLPPKNPGQAWIPI